MRSNALSRIRRRGRRRRFNLMKSGKFPPFECKKFFSFDYFGILLVLKIYDKKFAIFQLSERFKSLIILNLI